MSFNEAQSRQYLYYSFLLSRFLHEEVWQNSFNYRRSIFTCTTFQSCSFSKWLYDIQQGKKVPMWMHDNNDDFQSVKGHLTFRTMLVQFKHAKVKLSSCELFNKKCIINEVFHFWAKVTCELNSKHVSRDKVFWL